MASIDGFCRVPKLCPIKDRTSQSTAYEPLEMELQMKYTVIQEEERVDVNITRNADEFGCQFDSKELDIQLIAQNGNEWIVDLGQGPERMVVVQVGDRTEIYLRNQRVVASVYDTRKLALRMMDFAGGNEVVSPMTGRVVSVAVESGSTVEKGDVVVIVEAMKMENPMKAPRSGVVSEVCVNVGDVVDVNAVLITLEEEA